MFLKFTTLLALTAVFVGLSQPAFAGIVGELGDNNDAPEATLTGAASSEHSSGPSKAKPASPDVPAVASCPVGQIPNPTPGAGGAACTADIRRGDFGVVAPLTWADIASFKADTGHVTTEPAHVIFTGLETNFVSSARQGVVAGELLDQNARVRFTPVAWVWQYGDGTSRTTDTPGATWDALDEPEFSRTATSHAYTDDGDYTIRTAVTLRAEYSIAGAEWMPIAGTLTVPTDTITMTAYTASTVLVAEDCVQNPTGPGC